MKRTPLKRKTPLKKVSRKQASRNTAYAKIRREYLMGHPVCEYPGCQAPATDIHHKAGRGINTNEVQFFCGLCRAHHDTVHSNPNKARELGLLL